MYKNRKADTRPAYSNNISNNNKKTNKNQVFTGCSIAKNALKSLSDTGKTEVKSEVEAMQEMFNITGVKPEMLIYDGKPKCFYKNSTQRYSGHEKPDGTKIINYGDWKQGTGDRLDHTIIIKPSRPLSLAEQEQSKKLIEAKEKQREKEKEQKQQAGLKTLKKILNNCSSCHTSKAIKDNAYLKRKGFIPDQLKDTVLSCSEDGKTINIPLYSTIGGEPENIERIFEDSNKRPIEGLTKTGLFTLIGNPDTDTYYLSESFFTGFTAYLATEKTVVSCNGSSNIENVYLNLKKQRPDVNFILLADNDIEKEKEKGVNSGRETAEKLNNQYGLPFILSPVNSDFNDYYKGFIDEGHTREQALSKVKEYILNPDNIEKSSETPEQRIERLRNVYPFTTPPLEALPAIRSEGEEIKISEIIQDLADCIGCSANSMIGAALITPLICTGHFVNTKLSDTHIQKTRCNFCDVSLPSTGKTHGQEEIAVNLIKEAYKEEYEQYKTLLAEYKKKEAEFEAKLKKDEKPTPTEEEYLRHGEPINPGKALITGGTIQGYGKPDTAPPHGVKLLYLDECQSLAKDVLSNRSDTDAGGMTKLMDGSFHCANHATKDDGFSEIQVLMLGNTQPDNFEKYFKPLLKNNDGFGIRILYTIDRCGKPFEPKNLFRAWKPKYKKAWHNLVKRGFDFKHNIIGIFQEKNKSKEAGERVKPPVLYLALNEEAEQEFDRAYKEIGFNLNRYGEGDILATSVEKFKDFTLTIAASLYLLEMFGNNNPLATEINKQDTTVYMEARHIINAEKIIKFYIGQLVEIVAVYLMDFKGSHSVTDKRFSYLAETLEALRPDIEDGMLAKGYIAEKYTEKTSQKITPEKISSLLKQAGLTSTKSRKRINGKNSSCLIWDTKTDNFIKRLKPTGTTSKLEQTPINKGLELNRVENCNRNNTCKYEDEKKKVYGLKPTGTNQNVTETPVNKSVVPVNQLYGLNSDQQTKPVEQEQISFEFFNNSDMAVLND